MKIKLDKRVTLVLKLLVTGLALLFVFRKIDVKELGMILSAMNVPVMILAALAFIASKVVSSFRLNLFLKDEQIHISEVYNLKLYWLGMYYNLFLPGGIGGDGYKVYLLNKQTGVKVKYVLRAILMDRVTGLLSLVCLTAGLSYFLPLETTFKYLIWASLPLAIIGFYVSIRFWFSNYLKSFSATNLQAFAVQLLQVLSAYLILRSLGIESQYGQYLFVFLLSSVVATIPFTIGGVGAREVTFLIGAEYLGLQTETSLGLSLSFFFITAIVSLIGIYFSFRLPKSGPVHPPIDRPEN